MSGNKGHSNSSNNIVFVSYDAESFGSKEHGPITSHHVACTKCRAEKVNRSGIGTKTTKTNTQSFRRGARGSQADAVVAKVAVLNACTKGPHGATESNASSVDLLIG